MSPLPYSADSQTAATCHYRQPFRLYASDIYYDANITFLSQTRNKTDAFFGVFHSFVNPPPTGGTHGAIMTCRGRRARPTPKPTVVGMPPKANGSAGIRQGLPSGLAKRPVLQRQGGQPLNPLQARLFAEAGLWAPRPHATPAAEAKRPRPRPPTAGHNTKQKVPRLTTQHPQKIRIYLYHIAISL